MGRTGYKLVGENRLQTGRGELGTNCGENWVQTGRGDIVCTLVLLMLTICNTEIVMNKVQRGGVCV